MMEEHPVQVEKNVKEKERFWFKISLKI